MPQADTLKEEAQDIPDMDTVDILAVARNTCREGEELRKVAVEGNALEAPVLEEAVHKLEVEAAHSPAEEVPDRTSGLVGQQAPAVKCSANSGLWSKGSRRASFGQKKDKIYPQGLAR